MRNSYIKLENDDKVVLKVFLMGIKHSNKYNYDFVACIINSRVVMFALKNVNGIIYKYNITNKKVLENLYNEFQDNNNKFLDDKKLPEIIKTYKKF